MQPQASPGRSGSLWFAVPLWKVQSPKSKRLCVLRSALSIESVHELISGEVALSSPNTVSLSDIVEEHLSRFVEGRAYENLPNPRRA